MSLLPRIHRLFAPDGRCLNVALDHGIFHEGTFLPGLEDIARAIGTVVKGCPDAIQLAAGPARILQAIPEPTKPALVLRVDTTNVYNSGKGRAVYSVLMDGAVELAVRLDAAAIVVNLLSIPGEAELHAKCIRHIAELRNECDRFGMPLMVEPLVLEPVDEGRFVSSKRHESIALLVRQAVELGADLIKADACDPLQDFETVVEAASGKPVLVRGGSRIPLTSLLEQSEVLLQAGASGLVFGRNIVQHARPELVVGALQAILHRGASVQEALEAIGIETGVTE